MISRLEAWHELQTRVGMSCNYRCLICWATHEPGQWAAKHLLSYGSLEFVSSGPGRLKRVSTRSSHRSGPLPSFHRTRVSSPPMPPSPWEAGGEAAPATKAEADSRMGCRRRTESATHRGASATCTLRGAYHRTRALPPPHVLYRRRFPGRAVLPHGLQGSWPGTELMPAMMATTVPPVLRPPRASLTSPSRI